MTLDWESISGILYVFPFIIKRHNNNNNSTTTTTTNNNNNNNNMLCLPSAVFIALMLVGPSKDSKWRQTSWLFTSVVETLNSGLQ